MFAIFTSSKKLEFESTASPKVIVRQFRTRIADDNFATRLKASYAGPGIYVGTVEEDSVRVRYQSSVHSPLQPTMRIKIEKTKTGSLITARYSTSVFSKVFLFLWMGFALGICFMGLYHPSPKLHGAPILELYIFPIVGAILIVFMRLVARHDQSKLEQLVREVLSSSSD